MNSFVDLSAEIPRRFDALQELSSELLLGRLREGGNVIVAFAAAAAAAALYHRLCYVP